MRPTILLFDIDGTLVTTGGAGRRAMQRGFGAIFGRPEVMDFRMDGMTDRLIVKQALAIIGEEPRDELIERILEAYVDALRDEVLRVPDEHYRVHAGMHDAILHGKERGAAVGLGTGNVHVGARVKLERVGLHDAFGFGGFGSDAEERVHVLAVGAERGAATLGVPLSACSVVVIGDTPKDVAAAQGIGAACVGVATGSYSVEALLASGADHAFSDLTAPGALSALFAGS
jgi:phosphoglycolate phosphatase